MPSVSYAVEELDVPLEVGDDVGCRWRTLVSGDRTPTEQLTGGVCEIDPGCGLQLHRHPVLELYYFLEGTGVVMLEGRERPVSAGTTISIPADAPHGIRNTGQGLLKLFYVFPVNSFDEVVYTMLDAAGAKP